MAVRGQPSLWWPTPVDTARYFTRAELDASAAYHRPLARTATLATGARLALLVAAAALAARVDASLLAQFDGVPHRLLGAAVGAGLTVVAVRLPSTVADAWFEYRHEPSVLGRSPSPVGLFAAVVAGTTFVLFAATTVVAFMVHTVMSSGSHWPMALSLAVVASVAVVAVAERFVRERFGAPLLTLEQADVSDVAGDLQPLVARFGLRSVTFLCEGDGGTGNDGGPGWGGAAGATAYTTGVGPHRRVVLSAELLAQPPAARNFVVAHELAHVAGHHVLIQTALGAAAGIAFVWLWAALAAVGLPWRWSGLDPHDPCGFPVLALLVVVFLGAVRPVGAWFSRAQERRADLLAYGAAGADGETPLSGLGALYRRPTTDLDPRGLARLLDPHPAPAERLEFLRRLRSAGHVGPAKPGNSA